MKLSLIELCLSLSQVSRLNHKNFPPNCLYSTSAHPPGYSRRAVLLAHERLRGEVSLRGLGHLLGRALDPLGLQVGRVPEPVVLVPPDEEPNVLRTKQFLEGK